MPFLTSKIIDLGLKASDSLMFQEDKVWSKYSNDKVNIGETLARVIRTLTKAFPLTQPLRALSIGSSNEPQFRILQTAFGGGLYLLDIDPSALAIVKERTQRQNTNNVHTILNNFDRTFLDRGKTKLFLKKKLNGKKIDLITFQHSMYYCKKEMWGELYRNLFLEILASQGALYSVLMAAESNNPSTTTWLYNHFAGKFCGHTNDQDLRQFKKELAKDPSFCGAQILSKTDRVNFFVKEFDKFMSVVWMILLYPQVHRYTLDQRKEITEFCYKNFFKKRRPLIQIQDHLVIYRGIKPKGLI